MKNKNLYLPISIKISWKSICKQSFLNYIIWNCTCNDILFNIGLDIPLTLVNSTQLSSAIDHLRKIGCSIYLDNFGKSLSSFSNISNYSINEIKLDKSFIEDIASEKSKNMIKGLYYFFKIQHLNMSITGIDSQLKLELLPKYVKVQGSFFSEALNISKFIQYALKMNKLAA